MVNTIAGNVLKSGYVINDGAAYVWDTGTNIATALSPGYTGAIYVIQVLNLNGGTPNNINIATNTGLTLLYGSTGSKFIFQYTGSNTWNVYSQ